MAAIFSQLYGMKGRPSIPAPGGELWGRVPLLPGGLDNHTVYVPSQLVLLFLRKLLWQLHTLPWGTTKKEEKFYAEFMSIPLNSVATIFLRCILGMQIKHKDLL